MTKKTRTEGKNECGTVSQLLRFGVIKNPDQWMWATKVRSRHERLSRTIGENNNNTCLNSITKWVWNPPSLRDLPSEDPIPEQLKHSFPNMRRINCKGNLATGFEYDVPSSFFVDTNWNVKHASDPDVVGNNIFDQSRVDIVNWMIAVLSRAGKSARERRSALIRRKNGADTKEGFPTSPQCRLFRDYLVCEDWCVNWMQ